MTDLGKQGEDLVSRHYENLGYRILERNFIPPFGKQMGELDIVAGKDQSLIFVEVKARRSKTFGDGVDAVDWSKQQKLIKTAKLYVQLHPKYQDFDIQIDVASVDIDNPAQPVIILSNVIEDLS